jgi:hypothetical protein
MPQHDPVINPVIIVRYRSRCSCQTINREGRINVQFSKTSRRFFPSMTPYTQIYFCTYLEMFNSRPRIACELLYGFYTGSSCKILLLSHHMYQQVIVISSSSPRLVTPGTPVSLDRKFSSSTPKPFRSELQGSSIIVNILRFSHISLTQSHTKNSFLYPHNNFFKVGTHCF